MQRAAQLDQEQLPSNGVKVSLTKENIILIIFILVTLNIYLRLRPAGVQESKEEADSLDSEVRKMELIVHHRSVNL